jgi:predicted nucleic-acid-binding protein
MIGLDTNILARFFLRDDPEQTPKARAILGSLTAEEPGWIGLATMMELLWLMKSKKKLDRAGTVELLSQLLFKKDIVIEEAEVVQQALILYRSGKADFADCLIAASARAAGCARMLTFDRIAARDAGMQWAG